MQKIFVIVTSLAIGAMARKHGLGFIRWAVIGFVTFLVVDTIIGLLMLSALEDRIIPDAKLVQIALVQKVLVFAVFVVIFNSIIKARAGKAIIPTELTEDALTKDLYCDLCDERFSDNTSALQHVSSAHGMRSFEARQHVHQR